VPECCDCSRHGLPARVLGIYGKPIGSEELAAAIGPHDVRIEQFGPSRCMFEATSRSIKSPLVSCDVQCLWLSKSYTAAERAQMFHNTARAYCVLSEIEGCAILTHISHLACYTTNANF
jgi:hypothetical protein